MYTIILTKENFEELQNNKTLTINIQESKQEKWTPSSGHWNVSLIDKPFECDNGSSKKYSEAGIEYETKEEAIKASKALRSYARQLKWISENQDGWKADWSDDMQEKCYIYYDNASKIYRSFHNTSDKSINTIYMSKKNTEKLARLLNEGVVEF